MINALIIMTGLMAGIYFAFSVFIMKSLAILPAAEGAKAMNAINDIIVKTAFLPLFFLSTLAHLSLIIWSWWQGDGEGSYLMITAGVLYVAGMFLVTVFGNVPLNNRLKRSENNESRLIENWNTYQTTWTRLNHVRTLACTLSLITLLYVHSMP